MALRDSARQRGLLSLLAVLLLSNVATLANAQSYDPCTATDSCKACVPANGATPAICSEPVKGFAFDGALVTDKATGVKSWVRDQTLPPV